MCRIYYNAVVLMSLDCLCMCLCVRVRVNNSCRAASKEPVNTSQTVSSICDREVNSTDSEHSSIIPTENKGNRGYFHLSQTTTHTQMHCTHSVSSACLPAVYEPEEVLVPAHPEIACVERGYITSQQVYNLLNAEEGQPALFDPYYMLILDCRSADRWV